MLSDNIKERYALEVKLHYSILGFGLPDRLLWGNASDYTNFAGRHRWNKVEVEFAVEENKQFTLNFFAHHNDNCESDKNPIILDSISTLLGTEIEIHR